jgi:phage terminase large subunit-like protein
MENPFDISAHPFCHSGHQYAIDVILGEIPNCIYIIGACKRYLKDLEIAKAAEFPAHYFDPDRAERYLRLTQKFKHVKGKNWKTENITYEPWQNFIFMNIMGWINSTTGERRFRNALVEVPRGSGKSLLASQSCLYFLALDDPKGNEISVAATKNDQARIVLDSARAMAKSNPNFLRTTGVKVLAHKITHPQSNSFIRALSSDSKSLDGLNDVLCVIDELHAVDRKLFDVIYSGMKKRNDSLLLTITTAGFNTEGVGFSQSVYAKKVALGEVDDDTFFSAVYTIDEDDDIFSEVAWRKANPNYGVSVDPVTFEASANKVKITPADLPNFKVKNLNIWISEANAFFDPNKWDKGADPTLKIEDFKGQQYYGGLDLASKVDLAADVKIFRKKHEDGKFHYYFFGRSYIPEETYNNTDNSIYAESRSMGFLNVTKGEAINYQDIQDNIILDARTHKNIAVHFDPWNATQLAQLLMKERINMVEFRMNTANLSEPLKTFDALIREGRVHHQGDPLFRWCLSNVVCKEDAAGNVYPKKTHEKLKIDIIVAAVMALAGWVQEEETESVYETRGIRIL